MKRLKEPIYLKDPFVDEEEKWSDDRAEYDYEDLYSDLPFDSSNEF